MRFENADACERIGARTIPQLLALDLRKVLIRELRLREVVDPVSCNAAIERYVKWLARYQSTPEEVRADLKRKLFGNVDVGNPVPWHRARLQLLQDHVPKWARKGIGRVSLDPFLPMTNTQP